MIRKLSDGTHYRLYSRKKNNQAPVNARNLGTIRQSERRRKATNEPCSTSSTIDGVEPRLASSATERRAAAIRLAGRRKSAG